MTSDCSRLAQAVSEARADGRRLTVCGSGSKRSWLPPAKDLPAELEMLSVAGEGGIIDYQPEELVVTARAGTPIKELEQQLAQTGQQLAFEPPQFFGGGTLGGMICSGLSGPARPWSGSVRDAVLGVELVNGLGEHLKFGGQVMKNVAGYDVSRLLAGSFGALGVLVNASVRVQPRYERQTTLRLALDINESIQMCRHLARQYLPLSGTWWHQGVLYVRLSGSDIAVTTAARQMAGDEVDVGSMWQRLRDHSDEFFQPASSQNGTRPSQRLCRIIVPPATPHQLPDDLDGPEQDAAVAVEWAGGLRWLWHAEPERLQAHVAALGGWMWVLADASGVAAALPATQQQLMEAIKQAFDPDGVFFSPLSTRHTE